MRSRTALVAHVILWRQRDDEDLVLRSTLARDIIALHFHEFYSWGVHRC
jgi:hypothetical protein